jgi:nitroreductase
MNPIEIRKSTRNYQQTPLSSDDLEKIETYITEPNNLIGPYGNQFELELLLETNLKKKEKLGTYGFFKNQQGFVVGKSHNDPKALFEFGFIFENLILYLSSIGIGNCWLAGSFNRDEVMSSLSLAENEIIPAVTPIGYAKDTRHFKERIQRRVIKANQRKPKERLFFFENFDQPLGDNGAETYQGALEYVRIGPSAKNKQPWRILISKDLSKVHFYISFSLEDDKSFACPPEYLDIGVAYCHFKAGLDEAGVFGKLEVEEPEISKPEGYEYITTWIRD